MWLADHEFENPGVTYATPLFPFINIHHTAAEVH